MAQKRLTVSKFKKLLKKHPDFPLVQNCFIGSKQRGKPCAGCALTLAYIDEHPNAQIHRWSTSEKITDWANETFGVDYVSSFVGEFDGGWVDNECPNEAGANDGAGCMKLAFTLGRLGQED